MTSPVQAAALQLLGAACKGEWILWNAAEAAHASAATDREAAAAARPAVQMCSQCPVRDGCYSRARLDSYDGLAAGLAWHHGDPRPVTWSPRAAPGAATQPVQMKQRRTRRQSPPRLDEDKAS